MTVSENAAPQTSLQQPSFSFTQGFLLGQLSVVLLIGAFIKFFIFGEPSTPQQNTRSSNDDFPAHHRSISLSSANSPSRLKTKRSVSQHILRPSPRLTTASILSKTYYNVNGHPPESLDWFNVLIAQTISQFRRDAHDEEAGGGDALLSSLSAVLNAKGRKPDYVGEIRVTELSLGEEFPILSNCRIGPVYEPEQHEKASSSGGGGGGMGAGSAESGTDSTGPRLQARMDVDLSDFITLGIETTLHLNYPYPLTATLPISLAVSIVRFSGTLTISFLPSANSNPNFDTSTRPPETSRPSNDANFDNDARTSSPSAAPQTLAFSLLPDYRLDLHTTSQIGSRSRLQDMPKIGQLVDAQLRAWIAERCVEPRMQQVVLPSLWPRKGNVRMPGPGGGGSNNSGAGVDESEREREREMPTSASSSFGFATGTDTDTYSHHHNFSHPQPRTEPGHGRKQDTFEEGLRARRQDYEHVQGHKHEREREHGGRRSGVEVDVDMMPGSMPGTLVN